jgi:membrane fusion protein (multidrug efflux system)
LSDVETGARTRRQDGAERDDSEQASGAQDDSAGRAERQGPARADSKGDQASEKREAEAARKPPFAIVRNHPIAFLLVLAVVCAAVVAGILWWLRARNYETTDDAFIDGRPVAISAQVAGAIVDVPVTDNQLVKPGAVLARLDDRDYRAAKGQAEAQMAEARAAIANVEAQQAAQQARIDETAKEVTEARAALSFSRDENTRYQSLVRSGAGTVERAQQANTDLQSKQAALDAAMAAQAQAEKQIGVLKAQLLTGQAQLKQAQAQDDQAAANLSRVTLTAPVESRVTKLTAAVGAYAAPGQTLMMLVPTDLWVTANYKETDLAEVRPGQPVTIEIDAYGRKFPGRVDSIQAGSGDAFSLLPAENATGNYVKVVQRVPVKIVFLKRPDVAIGPGMSVVPSIRIR